MLEHHVTEAELASIERNAKGSVVRLVRYVRELRALLAALHPQVSALEPVHLHAVFDSEVAGITMERLTRQTH
jgi:hypothetical protein